LPTKRVHPRVRKAKVTAKSTTIDIEPPMRTNRLPLMVVFATMNGGYNSPRMEILHRVAVTDPTAHLVTVETVITAQEPLPDPLELFFAVWTPGSYLIREYARHVESLSSDGHVVRKIRKNAWHVLHGGAREVVVRYRVYCAELTVRTNHVDGTHAFLNGAPTFAAVKDRLDVPIDVELDLPDGFRVATALEATGPKRFRAKDYDTLVDSPIEAGFFRDASTLAAARRHTFAIWPEGAVSDANITRLLDATRTIVETEASLFGGELPHDGYTFLLHLASRGRGGLEHLASSALIAAETCFDTREGFLDLLSLISHEYLHLWNVKRIRPAALTPYRYEEECYTRLLWWFEGATSYFDWRVLRLGKLCTVEEYLDHLANEISYVESTPGRFVHALEAASFDAWIKLYRPDESSPNSTVSYYRKGELINAMLDLEIRARSAGKASLDAVLLHLWKTHGQPSVPVPEDAMQRLFEEATDLPLGDLFDALIREPRDIDVDGTFRHAGLVVERTPRNEATASLGIRTRVEGGRVYVASALRGCAAQRGGVDASDEIIAIGGRRIEGGIEPALVGKHAGEIVPVLVARDGHVQTLEVTLDAPRLDKVKIVPARDATESQMALRRAWLAD
jgi:predicted metalloprotease with PDZ domain